MGNFFLGSYCPVLTTDYGYEPTKELDKGIYWLLPPELPLVYSRWSALCCDFKEDEDWDKLVEPDMEEESLKLSFILMAYLRIISTESGSG